MKLSERPLEYCFICDEPTGRAGKGEDSLYCDECDKGPYCPECFLKHHESDVKVAQLEAELAKEKIRANDFMRAGAVDALKMLDYKRKNEALREIFNQASERVKRGRSKRLMFKCSHCQKDTPLLIDALLTGED